MDTGIHPFRRVAKGGLSPQSFLSVCITMQQATLFFFKKNTQFGQLILRKNIKIVATRCQILRPKCTKVDFQTL